MECLLFLHSHDFLANTLCIGVVEHSENGVGIQGGEGSPSASSMSRMMVMPSFPAHGCSKGVGECSNNGGKGGVGQKGKHLEKEQHNLDYRLW